MERSMTEIRTKLNDGKKDINPLGKMIKDNKPTLADRLKNAYIKDPATCDKFYRTPLWGELKQIITELELYDTRHILDLVGNQSLTDRLRGQVAQSRRILALLEQMENKVQKK